MAFNTLRGTVNFSNATTGTIESMVDDYSDQTLAGGKTFAQKLTASAISLAGSVLEHPAITAIGGDAENRVIVSDGDGTATCTATLVFSNSSLTASYYSGSAVGLTNVNLAPHKVSGQLSASSLFYGVGLSASQGNAIAVSGGVGIASTAQGVYVDLPSNSGLNFSSDKLIVDPNNATTKGSWSASDEVLIADSDASSALKKATVTTLATYMQNTLTFATPAGADNAVQTKSGTDFAGSANLTFDGTKVALTGDISGSGYVSASYFVGDGSGLSNVAGHVTPGGIDSTIQFHSGSDFSGSAKLLFDYAESTPILKLDGEFSASSEANVGGLDVFYEGIKRAYLSSSGEVSASAALSASSMHTLNTVINAAHLSSSLNISGSAFYGDGNKLNNVPIGGYTNTRLIFCGATTDTLTTYDGLTWSNPIMSVPGTVSATHLSASTLISASAFYGDGSGLTNVGSSPGGANTAVQFNSGSNLSGSSKLLFDYAESTAVLKLVGELSASGEATTAGIDVFHAGIKRVYLSSSGEVSASAAVSASSIHTLNTAINTAHISSSLNISGSAFYGDGSNLTGLSAGAVSSYTNSGDNRIITSVNSSTINGEANLTFDGAVLDLTGQISASLGISGSLLRTAATVIDATHLSSSLNISGSSFYGDGSNLTGLPSAAITTYDNAANNRIITSLDASAVNAEANLTFNGSLLTVAGAITASLGITGSALKTGETIIDALHVSSSLNISGGIFYGEGRRLTYPGGTGTAEIPFFNSGTLAQDASLLYLELGDAGPETSTLVIGAQLSASQTISASFFYGNGGNLTGLPGGTPATASGGTGEIQFARTTDGEFSSDGALVFNTGSSGASGTYLTASNLRINYKTHLTGALYRGYRIETGHYTLTSTDSNVYIAQNNPLAAALTGTLPVASTVDGIVYVIKNVGSSGKTVEISASSGDRFDGLQDTGGSKELAEGDAITIQSINGNTWAISAMYP